MLRGVKKGRTNVNRQHQGFFWGAVVALTVASSAFAGWNPDTKTYDTTGYVKLTTGDSGYSDTTCFEKPASWTWPASYGGTPAAMDPNADYCYNSASTVSRTPNTRDFTFNARTLAVNGQFHQSSKYYFTTTNIHLLNDGQFVIWGAHSRFSNCTFTVYSDAAHAFKFNVAVNEGGFSDGFVFLDTAIKGEEGAVMKFHGARATQKAAAFRWTGDGSQFYGTAIVDMPSSTVGGSSRLYLGPVNFAGTLVLTNGSQLANWRTIRRATVFGSLPAGHFPNAADRSNGSFPQNTFGSKDRGLSVITNAFGLKSPPAPLIRRRCSPGSRS